MFADFSPSSLTCKISRHFWENFRDQDRHFVLHSAFDRNPEAARLSGLVDDHLPPAGRDIAGDGDVGVALAGDDVDVIVQGNAQVKSLQSDAAIIDAVMRGGAKFNWVLPALVPVGLYQQVQHSDLTQSRTTHSFSVSIFNQSFTLAARTPITSSLWIIVTARVLQLDMFNCHVRSGEVELNY